LVDANLAGVDSHGVIRIARYAAAVHSGKVLPAERPEVMSNRAATGHVDGRWGWGQPAGRLASDTAVGLASNYGIGAVAIGRCNHIGRLGEYVERIAMANMIGLAACNSLPAVAAHGGRTRVLGTNPIAFAAPSGNPESPL